MPFPVTIDTASAPEQPGSYGPFSGGGDILYEVNYKTTEGDTPFGQLFMEKSTDGGATWAEADAGNGPIIATKEQAFLASQNYVAACACQSTLDPTQIYVCWVDQSLQLNISPFTIGVDTWGSAVPAIGQAGVIGCCVYREVDNSVVLAATGASVVQPILLFHVISSFIVFDIAGSSWGAWADLGWQDYMDVIGETIWNQRPCGITIDADGTAHVFMQQITRESSTAPITNSYSSSSNFNVPSNCLQIDSGESIGAGGGGGSAAGPGNGGGGGGGWTAFGPFAVTPGDTLPVTVGVGGASDLPGGDSDFNGVGVAGGGQPGTNSAGGAGGAGDNVGGDGGDGAAGGGGGGGGAASSIGVGGTGGTAPGGGVGGSGGIGSGTSGNGGSGGQTGGIDGNLGTFPGGGGGGTSGDPVGVGGLGRDGLVSFTYTPFTNSHPGRMWQQAVSPTNTLGTLTEIVEGEFPIGNGPVQFDCKAESGIVVVAFSGVTATLNAGISVGKALASTDVLAFTFQSINVDNAGSGIAPSPALALDGTAIYCVYMSAPSLGEVNYVYRLDSGLGFGAAVAIGTFADAGCRLQAEFFTVLLLTFGTPTAAVLNFDNGEGGGHLDFTAAVPGLDGNQITIHLIASEGAADLAVAVTISDVNQVLLEITFGYTLDGFGDAIVSAGSWSALADLINASAAAEFVTATGNSEFDNADSMAPTEPTLMAGGSTGEGTPTYFSGAPSPPTPTPTPITPISPGGPRFIPTETNDYDACLSREYRLYNLIDRELLSCAKKPHCFCYDERQWGGNYDDAEEIGQGPPTGSIPFNPTGQVPLPGPLNGDVIIFSTRVPLGYDGIILGQFHGYYPIPVAPGPITSVFVEGSGDIRWRVAVAARFAKDCGDITVTLGTIRTLSTIAGGIQVRSGDLLQYIVNVPNTSGSLAPGVGSILAGLHGWFWPRK